MTDSSQPKNLYKSLIDDASITIGATGSDTFTIELPSDLYTSTSYINTNMNTVSVTSVGSGYTTLTSDTITINGSDFQFSWNEPKEWVDKFPDWDRVKNMCSKYPGLEIALRNFETIYKLIKDDYDNPTPKK